MVTRLVSGMYSYANSLAKMQAVHGGFHVTAHVSNNYFQLILQDKTDTRREDN